MSEKLQLNPELTLEKAVDQARLNEAVKKQQNVIRGNLTQVNHPGGENRTLKPSRGKTSRKQRNLGRKGKQKSQPSRNAIDVAKVPSILVNSVQQRMQSVTNVKRKVIFSLFVRQSEK